jgi:hypothetical protein
VDLPLDRAAQQPVPARVVVDLVDPVAVAVVGDQARVVALGAAAVLAGLRAAGHDGGLADPLLRPAGPLADERLAEGGVRGQQVDVLEGRGLIRDPVRGGGGRALGGGHGCARTLPVYFGGIRR